MYGLLVTGFLWGLDKMQFPCPHKAEVFKQSFECTSSNDLCHLKSRRSIPVESIRNHDKALGLFHRIWPGSVSTEVQTQNTQMVMDKGAGDGRGGECSSRPARCLAPHRAVQSLISLCSVDKLGMFQCDLQALFPGLCHIQDRPHWSTVCLRSASGGGAESNDDRLLERTWDNHIM